ncbi:MAG: hypothetical protein E7453_03710 [Ruminococcaceae bacterium]|nr:hypothetical protein [Oscillospiraceae bacterium]
MRKCIRFICMILICSLLLAVPAYAESAAESRASAFFSSHSTDLYETSSTSFQIWFDVVSNAGSSPQELGASEIALYESADGQSWTKIKTYTMDDYPQMVDQNTTYHAEYVTYDTAITGYYYTARITFYAKNSRGIGELDVYTEIIRM